MPGLRFGQHRVFFVEHDLSERPHVHVESGGNAAKYWLTPIELFSNRRFPTHELTKIERVLNENYAAVMEMWEREASKR